MDVVSVWYDLFTVARWLLLALTKTSSLVEYDKIRDFRRTSSSGSPWVDTTNQGFRRTSSSGSPWAGTTTLGLVDGLRCWCLLVAYLWYGLGERRQVTTGLGTGGARSLASGNMHLW